MSVVIDLLVLYGLVGVACAVAILRRERERREKTPRAVWSAAIAIPLWPLWAPFVLGAPPAHGRATGRPRGASRPRAPRGAQEESGALARIEHALDEALDAVAGTPMSDVFSREVAERISSEVARLADRMAELTALSARRGLEVDVSAARLHELEARGAPERAVATARLQHESLARLEKLRAADAEALEELADLLEALRAQLLLARYAGSSADGAGAIVTEVWARLEGLGGAFEAAS